MNAAPLPAASRAIAVALGAGLVAGWLAVQLPGAISLQLGDPARLLGLLIALLTLGPFVFLALVRRPSVALVILVVAVWTNGSEVLVRFHGLPSLLQLLTIPVMIAALGLPSDTIVRFLRSPLFLAAGGWLLWNGASVFWAAQPGTAVARTLAMAKAWLIFALVAVLSSNLVRLHRAAWAVALSAAGLAALGLWQVLTAGFDRQFGGLARIKDAQIYGNVFEPRIAGPLGDPNFFAQILLMALPVALALGWSARSRPGSAKGVRGVSYFLASLLLAGLLLTYSRGAAVAMVLVLAAALLLRGVRPRHLAVAGVLFLSVALIAPFGLMRRLETLGQILPGVDAAETIDPDSSFAKRRLVTVTAWQIFTRHPVVGVGAGNYGDAFVETSRRVGTEAVLYDDPSARNYPHNLYLEVAAETGGVGLVLFGLMIVSAVATLLLVRSRAADGRQETIAALADGLLLALVGFLLTALFLHWEFPRYFELLLGLVAGLGLAADRSQLDVRAAADRQAIPTKLREDPETTNNDLAIAGSVAVVVSRFPKLTETFILREIDELERQGQPVVLVPLMRQRAGVIHDRARPWLARAVFTPWISGDILRANLSWLNRKTGVYVATLARVFLGSLASPTTLLKSLALFPKAAYLADRLSRERVGHVHAHFATHPATVALVVERLAGLGFSFTAHAHDIFIRRQLLAWKLRDARFVRVISDFNRLYLERRFPGCRQKLRVIHMGLDVDNYAADPSAQSVASRANPPQILCIASLQEHKGLDGLIDACAAIAETGARFRCRVIGEGPMRRQLERQVSGLGLHEVMDLSGAATEKEVQGAIADSVIVVQPSVVAADGQMEGIPVALMEAQASGRPVIASRLSGIPELIEHGVNGWLVEPGDVQALAESLQRLLLDPQLCERLGRAAARSIRQGFALETTVAALRAEISRWTQPPPVSWQALAAESLGTGETGGIARVSASPDALTLEVVVASGRLAIRRYVKRALDRQGASYPAPVRAAREAAALEWLAALSDDRIRAAELIAADERQAVVVTRECTGRRLDDLLREARNLPLPEAVEVLAPAARAAGDWLRRFQALEPLRFPGDEERRERSEGTAHTAEPPGSATTKTVPSHGDFWLGNIFVDERDGSVCVVDLEGVGCRSADYDAAWFLVHLQSYLRRPRQAPLWSALREAFIGAWDADGKVDRQVLTQSYHRARRRMRRSRVPGFEEERQRDPNPGRIIVSRPAGAPSR